MIPLAANKSFMRLKVKNIQSHDQSFDLLKKLANFIETFELLKKMTFDLMKFDLMIICPKKTCYAYVRYVY
jgi:hypothetical protein